jgi:hypothetical protein
LIRPGKLRPSVPSLNIRSIVEGFNKMESKEVRDIPFLLLVDIRAS